MVLTSTPNQCSRAKRNTIYTPVDPSLSVKCGVEGGLYNVGESALCILKGKGLMSCFQSLECRNCLHKAPQRVFLFQDCGCSNCFTFICSLLLLQAEKAFNFLCTELTF